MDVFSPLRGKPALPHGGTFSANPMTMRAGLAAMKILDGEAFARLDLIGDSVRTGLQASLRRHGVPGSVVGCGSLLKVHLTGRAVSDYRSALPDAAEAQRLNDFNLALLNRGVMAASYGLMALSTAMTDSDIAEIIEAMDGAVKEIANAM